MMEIEPTNSLVRSFGNIEVLSEPTSGRSVRRFGNIEVLNEPTINRSFGNIEVIEPPGASSTGLNLLTPAHQPLSVEDRNEILWESYLQSQSPVRKMLLRGGEQVAELGQMFTPSGIAGLVVATHPLAASYMTYQQIKGMLEEAGKERDITGKLAVGAEVLFPARKLLGEARRGAVAEMVGTVGGTALTYAAFGKVFKMLPGVSGAAGEAAISRPRTPRMTINLLPDAERINTALKSIKVVEPRKELGPFARYLGSPSQTFEKISVPAGELVTEVNLSAMTTLRPRAQDLAIARQVRGLVPELADRLKVDALLDNPAYNVQNLPLGLPPKLTKAYTLLRGLTDNIRVMMRDALREAARYTEKDEKKVLKLYPNDWGIVEGYRFHAFEGDWAVFKEATNIRGKPVLKPIDTGWRARTKAEAKMRAAQFEATNPGVKTVTMLDEVAITRAGTGPRVQRGRLKYIAKQIAELSKLEEGVAQEGMRDLRGLAGALAYGPAKPAPRFFGHAQPRKSNLSGWLTDWDAYDYFISGAHRFIQMTKLRPRLLKFRNQVADEVHAAHISSPWEAPTQHNSQLLGAVDSYIAAVEGRPNALETAMRSYATHVGFDPAFLGRAGRAITIIESMMKLGLNPIAAIVNMGQLINTFSKLGYRWTEVGVRSYVKGKHSEHRWLLDRLGVREQASKVEEEGFRGYVSAYRPRKWREVPGAAFELTKDISMFMFRTAEQFLRGVTSIGYYERARAMGMTREQSIRMAVRGTLKTQWSYGPEDAPVVLRNMPPVIKQFKTFMFKQMEFMIGLRGVEAARFWTAYLSLFGPVGLPGSELLDSIIRAGTKGTGRVLRKAEELTGLDLPSVQEYSPIAELKLNYPRLSRGLVGLTGIDVTKNIGYSEYFGPGMFSARNLTPPAISDLNNAIKYINANEGTDADEALSTLMRGASSAGRRAYEIMFTGLREGKLVDPRTGDIIQVNLSPLDRVLLTFGLTPLRISWERDLNTYAREFVTEPTKSLRGGLVREGRDIIRELTEPGITPEKREQLMQEIESVAGRAVERGVGKDIGQAFQERYRAGEQERLQRLQQRAPKPLRQELDELFREYREKYAKPKDTSSLLDQPGIKQASIALGALAAFAATRGAGGLSWQAKEMAVRSATELMNKFPAELTRKHFTVLAKSEMPKVKLDLSETPLWMLRRRFPPEVEKYPKELLEAYSAIPPVRDLLDGARRYIHGSPGLGIMQDYSGMILRGKDIAATSPTARGTILADKWPVQMVNDRVVSTHTLDDFWRGAQALTYAVKTAVPEQVRVYRGETITSMVSPTAASYETGFGKLWHLADPTTGKVFGEYTSQGEALEAAKHFGRRDRFELVRNLGRGDIFEFDRLTSFSDGKTLAESFAGKGVVLHRPEQGVINVVFETVGPVKRINVAMGSAFEEQEALTFGRWRVERVSVEKTLKYQRDAITGSPVRTPGTQVPTHLRIVIRQIDAFEKSQPSVQQSSGIPAWGKLEAGIPY